MRNYKRIKTKLRGRREDVCYSPPIVAGSNISVHVKVDGKDIKLKSFIMWHDIQRYKLNVEMETLQWK
jgi:hypothetical protein